jgi:CRP-like cAMP-binding protein
VRVQPASGAAPTFLRRVFGVVLDEPDLGRIQRASAISTTARWFYLIALLVLAYQLSGLAGLAALSVVRTIPTGLAVPLAGALGSRISGRRLMAGAYAGRAVAIGLAAVGGAGGLLWLILLAAGIDAVLGTLRRPVQAALLPLLTRSPGDLVAANVATAQGEGLAGLIGPLAGAVVLVLGDPVAVLVCSAAGFAIASVLAASLSIAGGTTAAAVVAVPGSLRAGVRALATTPVARIATVGSLAVSLSQGGLSVLLVPAATELLGLGEAGIGNLYAAFGLGGILATAGAARLMRPARLDGVFLGSMAFWGLPLAAIALAPLGPLALGMLVIAGGAAAVLESAAYGLLSRTLPSGSRAAGIAMFEGVNETVFGLGGVVAPVAVALFGERGAILAAGLAVAAAAVVLRPLLLRWRHAFAGRALVVEQLRRLQLFSPLPLTVLEELAADVRPHSFATGAVLMREGEHGDSFHVITAGSVSVSVGATTVATLGPDTGVGEIALLRDTRRTATVVALETTETLAIDGPAFVAAVASQTGSLTAAVVLAGDRLDEQVGLLDQRGAEAYEARRWSEALALTLRSRHARIGEGRVAEAALLANAAAEILANQGRFDEAEALLSEALGQLHRTDDELGAATLESSLGMVQSRMGRSMVGLTTLQHAAARLERIGAVWQLDEAHARTAECLLLAGLPGDAEARARATLARIGVTPDREALKVALQRLLGWCALVDGRPAVALARLTESLEAARLAGDEYQTALALRALAVLPMGLAPRLRRHRATEAAAILASFDVVRVAEPRLPALFTER